MPLRRRYADPAAVECHVSRVCLADRLAKRRGRGCAAESEKTSPVDHGAVAGHHRAGCLVRGYNAKGTVDEDHTGGNRVESGREIRRGDALHIEEPADRHGPLDMRHQEPRQMQLASSDRAFAPVAREADGTGRVLVARYGNRHQVDDALRLDPVPVVGCVNPFAARSFPRQHLRLADRKSCNTLGAAPLRDDVGSMVRNASRVLLWYPARDVKKRLAFRRRPDR